jgi:thiamine-phosphate pyrophosphorylase
MPVDFDLYLITDCSQAKSGNLIETVEAALHGGVRAIQLREKNLSSHELYQLAREFRSLTSRFKAHLFINDRIDIALAVDADGVHLGESSIPTAAARDLLGKDKLIGVSCHSLERAVTAEASGGDFITFGPVFFTPSKACYGDPVGLVRLAETVAALTIPVFGLGGVTSSNIQQVLDSGAHGIALISAIIAAEQPQQAAEDVLSTLRRIKTTLQS